MQNRYTDTCFRPRIVHVYYLIFIHDAVSFEMLPQFLTGCRDSRGPPIHAQVHEAVRLQDAQDLVNLAF